MSSSNPDDRDEPRSAPPVGDLNLESLGEFGASVLLIRNLAAEVVNAVEQMRGAATSLWNALTLLRYPDAGGAASAASAASLGNIGGLLGGHAAGRSPLDDLLNPLDLVGRAAHVTDIRRTSSPGTQQAAEPGGSESGSAGGRGSSSPFSAVADVINDVLGGVRDQPKGTGKQSATTDNGAPPVDGNGATTETQPSSPPDILGDVLARAVGTVTQPVQPVIGYVGDGLRHVAAAPLTGVRDVLDKVVSGRDETDALRKRGNALIRISYQPELQRRDVHPSFSRILDELLPDEARIVRFLAVAGAQPLLDVRTKTLFQVGSVLLAGDVSMVTSMAGCHWPDRDHHYFANLERLGLIDLSREPVEDYRRYALLEVQPAALHAIESGQKTITIYRSITLTAFGRQFIDACVDTAGYNAGGWDTDGRQDKIRGEACSHIASPSEK